jgi:hypothetical protein
VRTSPERPLGLHDLAVRGSGQEKRLGPRDEAHRFSNRGRKKVGKKRRLGSELDQVRRIGRMTRVALLKTLGSLAAVRSAAKRFWRCPVCKKHLSALHEWFARDVKAETPA